MLRSGFPVLGVSVQFTPRIAVGELPKLRPRILRTTESPECPALVEIVEVDRFNPKTLVVSYTDDTICTYSVEQLPWENFFRKAAHCQHQNQWSASTGNDVARISRSYKA